MSAKEFRLEFLQSILDLLWAQWCVLGIAGYSRETGDYCIDPEALIIATCHFGRYDQRLFDAMMEWLCAYEDLISMQRLLSLMRKGFPGTRSTLGAIAAYLFKNGKKHKWRRVAADLPSALESRPFFLSQNGIPLEPAADRDPAFLTQGQIRGPVERRALLEDFTVSHPGTLWIRLRAFMGVSSRTDICVYLITHVDGGHPTLIARVLGYAQGGFQQSLVSMRESGWVVRSEGRHEVVYTLAEYIREAFTKTLRGRPHWLTWPRLFRVFEILWQTLSDTGLDSASPAARAAELKSAMQEASADLTQLGFSGKFLELKSQREAEYLISLRGAWMSLFDSFHAEEQAG